MRTSLRPLAPLLVLALPLAGCDDPSCLFSGTCVDGAGGSGGNDFVGGLGEVSATFAPEGSVVTPAAPTLVSSFPGPAASVVDAHPELPIFIQFSESLAPDTVTESAFELLEGTTLQPIPTLNPILAGDGHVVVLFPINPLPDGGRFLLQFAQDQAIADLNGQLLQVEEADRLIADWVVNEMAAGPPSVAFAYPNDGETRLAGTSEIVIGFDRRMDTSTVDDSSFVVQVDGLQPPVDPAPVPLSAADIPGAPALPQVFRWIPRDPDGRLVGVGTNTTVTIDLSPDGAPILSESGDAVPVTETLFNTIQFSAPSVVVKGAGDGPTDAFGRADVFSPSSNALEISFAEATPDGVSVEIYLFGTSPSNPDAIRSLVRSVNVAEGSNSLTVLTSALDLFDNSGGLQFADGPFRIAVGLRRNLLRSGVRLFDGVPSTPAQEDAVFDTTPPMLLGLGSVTGTAEVARFETDLPDLALVGRATEDVAFAYVETDGGTFNNGGSAADPPPVAFSGLDGESGEFFFVTTPVPTGTVDPGSLGRRYELFLFDRAGNGTAAGITGAFFHVGIVGPGSAPTGAPIDVRVLDSRTYAPVSGATVFSHQEVGGAVTFVASATSGADGRATVAGAATGSTIVTVDAPGRDLFSFHGVSRDALDALVESTGTDPIDAAISGTVRSSLTLGNFVGLNNVVADSRFTRERRVDTVGTFTPTQAADLRATYGPSTLRSGRLGSISFIATDDTLPLPAFLAAGYLRGFALRSPLAPVGRGGEDMGVRIEAGEFLLLAPMDEQAIDVPAHALDVTGVPGFGTATGDPLATVEARAAGHLGPIVFGRGLPFSVAADQWAVLGGYSGLAGPAGRLGQSGAVDPDVHLHVSLLDGDGNEIAARPRVGSSGNVLAPIGVPTVLAPAAGGSAGPGFNVVVADRVSDASGLEGVTRVQLADSAGRRWTAWRFDTSDAAGDLVVSFPDIGSAGLESGVVRVEAETWAGPFDRGEFFYSSVERSYEAYARTPGISFTLP